MSLAGLDATAIARSLSQLADKPADVVDAFFERLEVVELPPAGEGPGTRRRLEEGFAVRLVRDGRTWLAARDGFQRGLFGEALRQVARTLPGASYPEPSLDVSPLEGASEAGELAGFARSLTRRLRQRHVAFAMRLRLRRHTRWVRVIGAQLAAEPQRERFYSLRAEYGWGHFGALLPTLDGEVADHLAERLAASFRARAASPPERHAGVTVLAPLAAAVLLHEAVAHALEADVLAEGGNPAAAIGVRLASPRLHVLDDPAAAPEGVRRDSDDEGVSVLRRWLLRDGVVEQPLADSLWAQRSTALAPGAARRGSRFLPPAPRCTHLEVLPGGQREGDLRHDAEGGLLVSEATGGKLDPLSGAFFLSLPYAHRIRRGAVAEAVGPCRLLGSVAGLLTAITGLGDAPRAAGAGWCAKGGQLLPIWATVPALRLEGVEVAG